MMQQWMGHCFEVVGQSFADPLSPVITSHHQGDLRICDMVAPKQRKINFLRTKLNHLGDQIPNCGLTSSTRFLHPAPCITHMSHARPSSPPLKLNHGSFLLILHEQNVICYFLYSSCSGTWGFAVPGGTDPPRDS